MILVDTSVLVSYLRSPSERVRNALTDSQAAICGVIRAELLHGARTEEDATRINAALDGFRSLEIPESAWRLLGDHLYKLRTHGIAVPFQDALLATLAILYGIEIWTTDAHFSLMQPVLPGLKLFAATRE